MADHPVDGGGSLRALLARLRPGDRVLLGPGDWWSEEPLPRELTLAGEPGARLLGPLRVEAPDVLLQGLLIVPEGELEVVGGSLELHGCVVRGGVFVGPGGWLGVSGGRLEDAPTEALALSEGTLQARGLQVLRAAVAGLAARDATLSLVDCRFTETPGLAIDLVGGCEATLERCALEGRQPALPALRAEHSRLRLVDCALRGWGGGLDLRGGETELRGCALEQEGGEGGPLIHLRRGKLTLSMCELRGAAGPGLVLGAGAEAHLSGVLLEDNDSERPPAERAELAVADGAVLTVSHLHLGRLDGQPRVIEGPEGLLQPGVDGGSPLALALALAAGADPTQPMAGGRTALHALAAAGRALDLARLSPGRVDLRDGGGRTPLFEAADAATVRALLDQGADPFARDLQGGGPLHARAERPDGEAALRALVLAGADPDGLDRSGATPLARALLAGQPANLLALVALGADPDRLLPDGRLPLSVYAAERAQEVVDALLDAGADPVRRDAFKKKPRFYADAHRVFRRTFRRLRHDPWDCPPLAASAERLGLSGADAAGFVSALAAGGERPAEALVLVADPGPTPWSALGQALPGDSPFWRVGEDPFGREAMVLPGPGGFLCLRREDLVLHLSLARRRGQGPEALAEAVWRDAGGLGLDEALALVLLIPERRDFERALGARRKRVTRAFVRRALDWLRPWLPEARARFEPELPEQRLLLAERLLDAPTRPGPPAFYHPLALTAALALPDPLHPLAHEWLDMSRALDQVAGLAGWSRLAGARPLTLQRLGRADDPRPLPFLELDRDGEVRTWLNLVTGRVATLDRPEPSAFDAADPLPLCDVL